jgi:hypothetical protein
MTRTVGCRAEPCQATEDKQVPVLPCRKAIFIKPRGSCRGQNVVNKKEGGPAASKERSWVGRMGISGKFGVYRATSEWFLRSAAQTPAESKSAKTATPKPLRTSCVAKSRIRSSRFNRFIAASSPVGMTPMEKVMLRQMEPNARRPPVVQRQCRDQ